MYRSVILALLTGLFCSFPVLGGDAAQLRIATFQVDATPPLGSPLCFGLVQPAKEIVDPLSARGIVLLTDEKPIVLCAVDWVGIGNEGHAAFCQALAEAAGTTADRVSVHTLHQHDAPGADFAVETILKEVGLSGEMFDPEFTRGVIDTLAKAVKESLKRAKPVTHLGLGTAVVEKVASNRRVLGEDGKVKIVRYSATRNPAAIAAPEGVIDPKVWLVSFWNGEKPLASITHYATHPQSYYGKGGVSCDTVGIAREIREQELPGVAHLHFNGASGNVTAGKYNTGAPELRLVLAKRLAAGMKQAWEITKRTPIAASDVRWAYKPVALPLRDFLKEDELVSKTRNEKLSPRLRVRAGRDLAYTRRINAGGKININCLSLGDARVVYMPGELFVEYQLASQKLRPGKFVAMAAYGDYGPGYIGTKIAYTQGGYETGIVSRTAPEVETVLMGAIEGLLKD